MTLTKYQLKRKRELARGICLNTPEWRKTRNKYITKNKFCVMCEKEGVMKFADVVDHIISRYDGGAMHDENNLQSLCHTHHAGKTKREIDDRWKRRYRRKRSQEGLEKLYAERRRKKELWVRVD